MVNTTVSVVLNVDVAIQGLVVKISTAVIDDEAATIVGVPLTRKHSETAPIV